MPQQKWTSSAGCHPRMDFVIVIAREHSESVATTCGLRRLTYIGNLQSDLGRNLLRKELERRYTKERPRVVR